MKPLILAIVFLVFIIVGSLTTLNYIENQSEELLGKLSRLEKLINDENWEQSYKHYKDFTSDWRKIDHRWSMLIDHYEIDYINMYLGELEAFIQNKDKTNSLAKLSSLQLLVKHIPEKERPSLKNIL